MSDLTGIEKMRLEILLGMNTGFVLNFSDRTFKSFVLDTTSIDIFSEDYGQCSKANRLRKFWIRENNYKTATLIKALIEYWKETRTEISAEDNRLAEDCLKIGEKLIQKTPIENLDVLQTSAADRDFSLLANVIREAIEKNQPETALDRLHTFITKYIRLLCVDHKISFTQEEALHSIFGKYVKFLKTNNLLASEMSERILKSSISVLEAFNDVRNNQSFAHDNAILNYNESIFIFNSIFSAIKFIESIEKKHKNKKQ